MIQPYKVTALRMGLLKSLDYSQIVYLRDMGKRLDFPVWTVLIQGQGKNILVDLGIYDPKCASEHIIACVREGFDDPREALQEAAGITPADIDFIVFTHLHWDHIGESLAPFTKARFVVQEPEWRYMFHPVSYQQWAYASSVQVCMDPQIDFFRWQFVEGWVELLPGIKLVPTPGHTPGHQAVLIKTAQGRVMVTGDAMNMIDNLNLNLPSAITSDGEDYMASMETIRAYSDFAIGGHDLSIKPFQTDNFPRVRK